MIGHRKEWPDLKIPFNKAGYFLDETWHGGSEPLKHSHDVCRLDDVQLKLSKMIIFHRKNGHQKIPLEFSVSSYEAFDGWRKLLHTV